MASPQTFAELFQFYNDTVKPLYSEIQLTNELPAETLFEINAAWDHLSRAWTYGDTEPAVVAKAYSHLKRSVLDIFKLVVRNSIDQFEELTKVDISIIDNGAFEVELRQLHHSIKELARSARAGEGDVRRDDKAAIAAFDLWAPVYDKCKRLEKEYYRSEKWVWAKQRHKRRHWKELVVGFLVGVVASVAAAFIYDALKANGGATSTTLATAVPSLRASAQLDPNGVPTVQHGVAAKPAPAKTSATSP
jgi:hypothetical protein